MVSIAHNQKNTSVSSVLDEGQKKFSANVLWFMNGLIMLDCFLWQNAGLYTIWVVPSLNTMQRPARSVPGYYKAEDSLTVAYRSIFATIEVLEGFSTIGVSPERRQGTVQSSSNVNTRGV